MMLSDIYNFRTGIVSDKIKNIPDILFVADIEPVAISIGDLIYVQSVLYNNEDCHIFSSEEECNKYIMNCKRRINYDCRTW